MKGGIMYDQGDIVLIPFPYSDLTSSKKRPALIISKNQMDKMQDKICCLITSKYHKGILEIKRNHFETGNLPFKSFVKPHRIFTIDQNIILKKLCKINKTFHKQVRDNLNKFIK